jgi:adenine-specific DNA-methyltransferase
MAKKDYSSLDKDELLAVIEKLEVKKKYGLVWDDERVIEKIVSECQEKLPVLTEVKKKEISTSIDHPTHIIIEGDNYHALSVLSYTHKGKIDAIYIDPPYNTGAKDWKYNNAFVDKNDTWRHSKWIQFMYNRLVLAKELLTENGSLICAIDHNEQENIGILLRELFPNKEICCVTIVHNPRGIQGDNFSYTHENAYFVHPKGKFVSRIPRSEDEHEWGNLRNWGGDSERVDGKSMFYPITFKNGKIIDIGEKPDDDFHPETPWEVIDEQTIKIWPIDNKGVERKWRYASESLKQITHKVKLEKIKNYYQAQLLKDEDRPKTVWTDSRYDANIYGTQLLGQIISTEFPYPKSLYTVKDCLKAVVRANKNATILDYFAGSGTTGHAVLDLNKDDNGKRKFILCTNNESNICNDVTYPRIEKCIIGYEYNDVIKETLFEKRVTLAQLRDSSKLLKIIENIAEEKKDKYDEIKTVLKNGILTLTGIKKSESKKEGYGGNLKYFRADQNGFVHNNKNNDQLKIDITKKCTEMLCLKEGIFNLMKEEADYKIFHKENRYLAVYYDFANTSLDKLKDEMNALVGEKVLYCFSLDSQGLDKYNFRDWKNIRLEPIPQKILDVYKRIFKK